MKEVTLIDMTKLTLEHRTEERGNDKRHLLGPVGCDGITPVFVAKKIMFAEGIKVSKRKLTGLRAQGEKIKLNICRIDELWKVGRRDGRTFAIVAL